MNSLAIQLRKYLVNRSTWGKRIKMSINTNSKRIPLHLNHLKWAAFNHAIKCKPKTNKTIYFFSSQAKLCRYLASKSLSQKSTYVSITNKVRVSVQGVESLWGDCRFIPADWGS